MFIIALIACLNIICNGLPAKDPMPVAGNLKYTFGSDEEIPAAFFSSSQLGRSERKVYPPCQDGSGGMCIELGQCPQDLRPERNNTAACAPGLECCFGPGIYDKTCGSRGGECTVRGDCINQPIFSEASDCDTSKGQICCIHT